MGLGAAELAQIDALLGTRVKLRKATLSIARRNVHRALCDPDRISQTTVLAEDGREQVSGYPCWAT